MRAEEEDGNRCRSLRKRSCSDMLECWLGVGNFATVAAEGSGGESGRPGIVTSKSRRLLLLLLPGILVAEVLAFIEACCCRCDCDDDDFNLNNGCGCRVPPTS